MWSDHCPLAITIKLPKTFVYDHKAVDKKADIKPKKDFTSLKLYEKPEDEEIDGKDETYASLYVDCREKIANELNNRLRKFNGLPPQLNSAPTS